MDRVELQVRAGAFNRRIHTFAILDKMERIDIDAFLKDAFYIYEAELERTIELHKMIKSSSILVAEFEKKIPKLNVSESESENGSDVMDIDSEEIIKQTLYFTTPSTLIGLDSDLSEHYRLNIINELLESVENTAIQGSGFTLSRIIELNVQIS